MKLSRTKRALTLLVVCAIPIGAIVLGGGDPGASRAVERPPPLPALLPTHHWRPAPASGHPNIVFILTDDLSMDLLRFMPHVQAMERLGVTFNNYFVSDSLCCPSRSSIFTGNFPHDTHVFGNSDPTAASTRSTLAARSGTLSPWRLRRWSLVTSSTSPGTSSTSRRRSR